MKIRPTSAEDIADLRRAHLEERAAPIDGMWESFTHAAAHWELFDGEAQIGYFCVDGGKKVLQLHLVEAARLDAAEIFAEIVRRDDVDGAIVDTADALLLGLCLDAQKKLRVHSYLYRSVVERRREPSGLEGFRLQEAQADELEEILEFQHAALGEVSAEWLRGYSGNLISRGELCVLRSVDGAPAATGEARVSETQAPYVDLGVIVGREFRGRGVAPHVLRLLRERCAERGLKAICSTTVENQSSQRAIRKAGFIASHRLLEVVF